MAFTMCFLASNKSDVDAKNEFFYPIYQPPLIGNSVLFVALSCCSELYSTAHVLGVGERLSDVLTLAGFVYSPLFSFKSNFSIWCAVIVLKLQVRDCVCVSSLG